jgi:ABC-type amino acid transport system permease subunit
MSSMFLQFLPELLAGFLVNLEIAAGAVALGLAAGMPLALLRLMVPRSRRVIWPCVRLMQAAPTYVIMYFALNLLPRDLTLFGTAVTGLAAVILAQAVYMASYVAENGFRALEYLRAGQRDLALLFLPNLLRGWVVVIMSSGFGAAIGVSEAVGVTMRHAERLHAVGDRVELFVAVIALFVVVFGTANLLIGRLMRSLAQTKKLATVR